MNLLSCTFHFISLGSKYSSDHPVLSTLELCTFVWVTDQVSHTYKTIKGKGVVVLFMP